MTPPVAGADFLAALVASCFLGMVKSWERRARATPYLGALPPVDLRAVCLVRAMAE